jgi:hypothetical protein
VKRFPQELREQNKRVEKAVQDADYEFWQVIARAFPEITTGDLAIDVTIDLQNMMIFAVEQWLDSNTPDPTPQGNQ